MRPHLELKNLSQAPFNAPCLQCHLQRKLDKFTIESCSNMYGIPHVLNMNETFHPNACAIKLFSPLFRINQLPVYVSRWQRGSQIWFVTKLLTTKQPLTLDKNNNKFGILKNWEHSFMYVWPNLEKIKFHLIKLDKSSSDIQAISWGENPHSEHW